MTPPVFYIMSFLNKNKELRLFLEDLGIDPDFIPSIKNLNLDHCTLVELNSQPKKEMKQEIIFSEINNDRKLMMSDLVEKIKQYEECKLKNMAQNTVIYDGQLDAKIMLIGEAPGEEEDKQGIPFCGRSGRLLDNVFESIDLSRKTNLFITNTIFWRPPGNRKPTEEEILQCRPFLARIIDIISPEVIILCGSTAVQAIFDKNQNMSSNRQKLLEIDYEKLGCKVNNKAKVFAIYHPAYLLRNPIAKKSMWFDMLFIKDKANL